LKEEEGMKLLFRICISFITDKSDHAISDKANTTETTPPLVIT